MYVSFLDLHGLELMVFEFNKITPTGLSQFEVSYATTAANFSTFSLGIRYNRFSIKRRVDEENYSAGKSE
jgi:hypothetical protein